MAPLHIRMSTVEIDGWFYTTHPHATWQDWNTHLRHDYSDRVVDEVCSYFSSDHNPSTCAFHHIQNGDMWREGTSGLEIKWKPSE